MPRQHCNNIVCVFKVSKSFETVALFIFNACAPPRKVCFLFCYFVFESLFLKKLTLSSHFPIAKKWLFRKLFTVPDQCFLFIFLTGENFEPVSFFVPFPVKEVLTALKRISVLF